MDTKLTTRVAELNDRFRHKGFGVTLTCGVQALADVAGLMKAVRLFDTFSEDNDPYGEHDFGMLTWSGNKVFWKIDYYNQTLDEGKHPLSEECRRILTVMLAEEY